MDVERPARRRTSATVGARHRALGGEPSELISAALLNARHSTRLTDTLARCGQETALGDLDLSAELPVNWPQIVPEFDALALLRLFNAREELGSFGTYLHNINGLLNLVAWQRSLEGHLVPHGHLPDSESAPDASRTISITQNGLREVRKLVAETWDAHTRRTPDGDWARVRKEGNSFFADDRAKSYYVGETRPAGVFVTATRSWWCECETPESAGAQANYERWQTLYASLLRSPLHDLARNDINAAFARMGDPNGKFAAFFQGPAFHARLFEIACFSYLEAAGLVADRTYDAPDFMVAKDGVTIAVEVVTANPPDSTSRNIGATLIEDLPLERVMEKVAREFPRRMNTTLKKKVRRGYHLEAHVAEKPIVLMTQPAFEAGANFYIDESLAPCLYGDGGENSGFFSRDDARPISAIACRSS